MSSRSAAHRVQPGLSPHPRIRNVIAVGSGKGGVGKSTTAVNLAVALQQLGARVGVLDADIYGPSVPAMLGLSGRPESPDNKSIEPMRAFGVETMSIGFLVDQDSPMIWRGPMATSALTQLFKDTRWDDLDYLIVDLPPGTGDIQLTLAQKIPVAGAVIVTTPQDIATLDARKALKMFEKVEVPVLGIVENMAVHTCSNCGHVEHLFGEAAASAWPGSTGCRCWARCHWTSASANRATWARRSWPPRPGRRRPEPTWRRRSGWWRSWASARARGFPSFRRWSEFLRRCGACPARGFHGKAPCGTSPASTSMRGFAARQDARATG